jgi:hypothetical protein
MLYINTIDRLSCINHTATLRKEAGYLCGTCFLCIPHFSGKQEHQSSESRSLGSSKCPARRNHVPQSIAACHHQLLTWEPAASTHMFYEFLVVCDLVVRYLALCENLPCCHSEGPHVAFLRVSDVCMCMQCMIHVCVYDMWRENQNLSLFSQSIWCVHLCICMHKKVVNQVHMSLVSRLYYTYVYTYSRDCAHEEDV